MQTPGGPVLEIRRDPNDGSRWLVSIYDTEGRLQRVLPLVIPTPAAARRPKRGRQSP